jgi:hypothetical protein
MRFSILLSLLILSGCSTIGDAVIPPHERSLTKSGTKVCARLLTGKAETFALAPILSVAVDKALELSIAAIKSESKRYDATYSARDNSELLQLVHKGKSHKISQRVSSFSVYYLFGAAAKMKCDANFIDQKEIDNKSETRIKTHSDPVKKSLKRKIRKEETLAEYERKGVAMKFEATIELSTRKNAIKIIPTEFMMIRSSSKVPGTRWYYPWSFWTLLAPSVQKVDVVLKTRISGIVDDKGKRKEEMFVNMDIPFGKVDLNHGVFLKKVDLKHLVTGWSVFPQVKAPKTDGPFLPVNLTVTFIESSDLGDVIAKGAAQLEKNQDAIKGKINEYLIEE